MKQNVAIIIPTLYSGGAEKQSVYLSKVLCSDYNVFLVILKGLKVEQKFLDIIKDDPVNIIKLNGGYVKNFIDVYQLFRKKKIKYIFSYLASANLMNAIAGKLAKVPYRIGGIRNAELSSKKLPFERFFHNRLLSRSISNSYSAVEELSKYGFRKDKFHVIHNAIELKQMAINKIENPVVRILSVSRFVPQKDHSSALKAIKCLNEMLNDKEFSFRYVIVGYGVLEKPIKNLINELGIGNFVELSIKPQKLSPYFINADVFFSSSLYEGMSNSVMEALSYSLPVVSTESGDINYLVKDGYNGYLCRKQDPQDMANKLYKIITDTQNRLRMGGNSYQHIKENFSLHKFQKIYLNFINEVSQV